MYTYSYTYIITLTDYDVHILLVCMYVVFVQFDRNQYNVREDGGSVQITLVLNMVPGVPVNAMVTTMDITATSK